MSVKTDGIKKRQKYMNELKKIMPKIVSGAMKKNAVAFTESFRKWIKANSLGLDELAEVTVTQKKKQGMKKPEVPLYGKGDDEKPNSYSSMMRIREINGGWKVFPSKKPHWSKNITLDHLFAIHEFGCKINRTSSTGKSYVIQIPERPALKNAHDKFFSVERNRPEYIANRIKSLSKRFLNSGDKEIFAPFLDTLKQRRDLHE